MSCSGHMTRCLCDTISTSTSQKSRHRQVMRLFTGWSYWKSLSSRAWTCIGIPIIRTCCNCEVSYTISVIIILAVCDHDILDTMRFLSMTGIRWVSHVGYLYLVKWWQSVEVKNRRQVQFMIIYGKSRL